MDYSFIIVKLYIIYCIDLKYPVGTVDWTGTNVPQQLQSLTRLLPAIVQALGILKKLTSLKSTSISRCIRLIEL